MVYLFLGLGAMLILPAIFAMMVIMGMGIFAKEVGKSEYEDHDG